MPDVMSFQEAIKATEGEDKALLLGNGFSAHYFNYNDLLEQANIEEGSSIKNLFDLLETVDFEAVIQALEAASLVERAYDHGEHAHQLETDAQRVREALVTAVNETHPAHREELDVHYESAATFLKHFGKVFSLNYDLLLNWVNLHKTKLNDGFGKGDYIEKGRFLGPFIEDAYCDIYNLHGGLHLFQDHVGDVFKALKHGDGVIANITYEIANKGRLPLYVAEGTSDSKLHKINSVGYLRHCYSQLKETTAAVFVFGHSAAENDAHIYRAIFNSDAKHLYFGIFKPDETKVKTFDAELAKYKKLGNGDVDYSFFDSETALVWDGPPEEEDSE